ncbi:MAG: hypothetical protein QM723_25060 [Myxococcaceae bacterium]
MSLYALMIFVHVLCVLGMFAALALEGLSLRRAARATTAEQAAQWTAVWRLLMPMGMPSLLGALASGIYLATAMNGWSFGWTKLAVPALVLVALAGAVVGPRRNRVVSALTAPGAQLSAELHAELAAPRFEASWRFRAAVLVGVVFAMTVKPLESNAVIVVAVVLACAAGWAGLAFAKKPSTNNRTPPSPSSG